MPTLEAEKPNLLLLPDGNRRWARLNNSTEAEAYERGAARIAEFAHYLGSLGFAEYWVGLVRPLNLMRNPRNVRAILDGCLRIYEIGQQTGKPFNVTAMGRISSLPPGYAEQFLSQQGDPNDHGFTLHMLLGWSAEIELVDLVGQSTGHVVLDLKRETFAVSPIKKHIDLVVRTGMTKDTGRLSGMLPLHSLDAEIFFTDTLFPDFQCKNLNNALVAYANRYPKDIL